MNDLVPSNFETVRKMVDELGNCLNQIDMMYLKTGAILSVIKEHKLYREYASHTDTFQAFLKEIDLGIGMSQADHYIRVFRTFGDLVQGKRIAFKRLLLIHPLCKDAAETEHWIEQAESLPWQGLQANVKECRGKIAPDACSHPAESRTAFERCEICNTWIKTPNML
jgi:hypothetical protein